MFNIYINLNKLIVFNKFTQKNGLTVLHHQDTSSQLCVLNTIYRVGSKDENPNHTGFAHLFEHLMFGGSINIKDFDTEYKKLVAKAMLLPVTILQIIM